MRTAQERLNHYLKLEAKVKVKKTKKKTPAKAPAKSKGAPASVKAKHPDQFFEKMDVKLEKLAKKHNVKITVRKNKKKMPVALVTGLRKKPYGEVVDLFKEISNSSPVPQKMINNGASFNIFGRPKAKTMSANESFENEDTSTEDETVDDSGSEDGGDFEKTVSDAVATMEQYGIPESELSGLIDKAATQYAEDLKSGSAVEDKIAFIVDTLDPEEFKNFVETYANKSSL